MRPLSIKITLPENLDKRVERIETILRSIEDLPPHDLSSPLLLVLPATLHQSYKWAVREIRYAYRKEGKQITRSIEVLDMYAFDKRAPYFENRYIIAVEDTGPEVQTWVRGWIPKLNNELGHRLFMMKEE